MRLCRRIRSPVPPRDSINDNDEAPKPCLSATQDEVTAALVSRTEQTVARRVGARCEAMFERRGVQDRGRRLLLAAAQPRRGREKVGWCGKGDPFAGARCAAMLRRRVQNGSPDAQHATRRPRQASTGSTENGRANDGRCAPRKPKVARAAEHDFRFRQRIST